MHEAMLTADGRPMVRDVRPFEFEYDGRTITLQLPGWYDPEGREDSVHGGSDLRVWDRALNSIKAIEQGLLTAEQIRAIRKELGLTQVEAGQILVGKRSAFAIYERGDQIVPEELSRTLQQLKRDPAKLEALRVQHGKRAA